MEQKKIGVAVVLLTCMVIFLQVGCSTRSKTASFYILSSMKGPEFRLESISPVSLPKYLKKSQIVTRTGSNELHLAEFDLWAGKIEEDIGRVIADNLTNLLATDKVFMYPLMDAVKLDYTIKIDISRFDGELGSKVELIVRWSIFDSLGNMVKGPTATHLVEPVIGPGYPEMVAAQSQILASLSRQLAEVIIELSDS